MVNFTASLQELVSSGFNQKSVGEELKRQNFITLRQDCILKALQGITTLEEVFRITQL
jgi:type II secretory ATPase GspE/PulE/Tfp pilus assembly ATPase PilB-like protein